MVTLWERLGESLGATFLNQYGPIGEQSYRTWVKGLSDLEPQQIKNGFMNFIRSSEKYIDLKIFRAFCLDLASYGLPDPSRAYLEAAMHCHEYKTHNWSHLAVYKTLIDVGISTMRELPESRALPLFKSRYSLICEMVIRGESLNVELPKAIPPRIPKFLTREENISRMAKMRAETGI